MFGFVGNAQDVSKRYKACVTVSCCGIGPFGFEIWSQTTCYWYEGKNKVSLQFSGSTKDTEITFDQDYLLAGVHSNDGEDLVLPNGKYQLTNNEIIFTPKVSKPKVHCIGADSSGTIFGHHYEAHSQYCWTWLWDNKSNSGNLTITPEINASDKLELSKGNTEITIEKDVILKDDTVNYTLLAGKYILNQDGNIYLQNVILK